MSPALTSSTILQTPINPPIDLLVHTPLPSIFATRRLRVPLFTRAFTAAAFRSPDFSSHWHHGSFSQRQPEEEEPAIGDCLVYEEGIFDNPYLEITPEPPSRSRNLSRKALAEEVSPENLIPEEWADVQREVNISKKERRRILQQLDYGKRVEKRRQAMRPLYSAEEYEKFKSQKLQQLNPLVLDKPELKTPEFSEEHNGKEHGEMHVQRCREVGTVRVAPRNPRLAVYGGSLEDVSAFLNSESYDPATPEKSQGTRKLFSKEEKALLNRRVPDLAVATSGKWNPLHTLAASGEFYLVNALLKHNHDINALDMNGLTPVHMAILGRKQAVFNFLLRESANPFVRDKDGATLMHYAVFTASTQMIKILFLYNVDVNLQDNDGWTPLHLAVQSRRTDVIRLLLIKGADISIKNRNGCTALDLCLYSGRDTRTYEVIKLLKLPPKS